MTSIGPGEANMGLMFSDELANEQRLGEPFFQPTCFQKVIQIIYLNLVTELNGFW